MNNIVYLAGCQNCSALALFKVHT